MIIFITTNVQKNCRMCNCLLFLLVFFLSVTGLSANGFVTGLRGLGFSLVPSAQKTVLDNKTVLVDNTWQVVSGLNSDHAALKRLRTGTDELYGLSFSGGGEGRIRLKVDPNSVQGIDNPNCSKQAYKLTIQQNEITISGNSDHGLFYGVQSFLQLLKPAGGDRFELPSGVITDWPALELRFIHWDTKHHQDRLETLKRYIDWAAYLKVNAIGFEIEDKYEYPSHPVIGAPGAFKKEEMQELTRYALERFIQLVPQVQAPAHMAYVLKHDEFAHLRSDGNNYLACMCDEEAISLILDMYQDMIDATPGVEYFHVSTDEIYYAGICEKCSKPYNIENRSQAWIDYVNRIHAWLSDRGRKMLCWVEYPLLPEHIKQLPGDIIDGIMRPDKSPDFRLNENKHGIRQLAYSSQQGSELLFPNYFGCTYRGREIKGRLDDASNNVKEALRLDANLVGTFAAAWGDAGLHSETFWLGWATVTQYGWTPEWPSVQQHVADFMDVFYGSRAINMVENYYKLLEGARFFESSWDMVPADDLPPKYGNSRGKKEIIRQSRTLELPGLPVIAGDSLKVETNFGGKYAHIIREARKLKPQNERLINSLYLNLGRVNSNQYNIEVLLSIAMYEKHFMEMILALESVEKNLSQAGESVKNQDWQQAVNSLKTANITVRDILNDRKHMWAGLKAVWEKSRFPKGRSVNGRDFVHELDNVKDHFADRRPGLDYMLAPFERMGLEQWSSDLEKLITEIETKFVR